MALPDPLPMRPSFYKLSQKTKRNSVYLWQFALSVCADLHLKGGFFLWCRATCNDTVTDTGSRGALWPRGFDPCYSTNYYKLFLVFYLWYLIYYFRSRYLLFCKHKRNCALTNLCFNHFKNIFWDKIYKQVNTNSINYLSWIFPIKPTY